MNSLQRAWRSVMRKPIKSILLLPVMVTVCLFLLCGMACRNANVQTQDTTRQAIGAGLRPDANEKNRSKRLTDSSEKIAAVTGISDYNISTCITAANPVGFDRIEDPDMDQTNDMSGVVLIGNRKMELDFNVLSGNVTLKEGRMVTEKDQDVCAISEKMAEQDQLDVGDKIGFNDYHDTEHSQVHEAAIIGIYQTKQLIAPLMAGDTFRSENIIFTDLRFPEKAEGSENDPCFEHAYNRSKR